MYDIVQITGSLLILAGFVASLIGWVDQTSYTYLGVNAVGSAALTVTAVIGSEPGFIMLEGVWAVVSVCSIVRRGLGRAHNTAHDRDALAQR
jgi:hypothetical protein